MEWRKRERRAKVQALVTDDENLRVPMLLFATGREQTKSITASLRGEVREEPMAHGDTLDAGHKRGVIPVTTSEQSSSQAVKPRNTQRRRCSFFDTLAQAPEIIFWGAAPHEKEP